MIHDIDQSLRELLEDRIVQGANIEIAFDAPNQEWASKRQGPALNVFLYDVREDVGRRPVQFEPVVDGEGIVTARQTRPRRFNLEYLVTTWAQRPEDEHRLLAAVLELFLAADHFPTAYLRGSAVGVGDLRTTVGLPLPPDRRLSDVWGVLGIGLRPVLDLTIVVPLGVRTDSHVGPPVLEGPRISVLGPDGEPMAPMRTPAERVAVLADTLADAAAPSTPAPRGSSRTSTPPITREVVDAGRFRGGRQVVELSEDDVKAGRRVGITTMPRPRR